MNLRRYFMNTFYHLGVDYFLSAEVPNMDILTSKNSWSCEDCMLE